ncbi:hypothetical protein KY289_023939 [Solanum tuberosum]|nr:hypothetical protein KY289_023939 [Solanum tuberosum]
METMSHLLLTAPTAQRLWKQFASCAGFSIEGLNIHQLISKWWDFEANPKLQHIMKANPVIVMWELCKRRNARRHGWVKCNTDGARKGNSGESFYGFCVRDRNGNLLYAEAQNIRITTNMEAELRALGKV